MTSVSRISLSLVTLPVALSTWTASVETINIGKEGFYGGFAVGSYGYLTPESDGGSFGTVYRLNLDTWAPGGVDVATLDLGAGLEKCRGSFTDGTYGYFLPTTAGKVARVDLSDFSTVSVLDFAASAGQSAYIGTFADFDRDVAYLVPAGAGGSSHGVLVRFRLSSFAYEDKMDLTQKDGDLKFFRGGFHDGMYGYVIPGASPPYKIARWPLASFGSIAAVEVLDTSQIPGVGPLALFRGGFHDGTYGYAVPLGDGKALIRWSLSTFVGESVTLPSVGAGFTGGFAHGGWGYLWPTGATALRFELANWNNIETLNLGVSRGTMGFTSGVWAYVAPGDGNSNMMARFEIPQVVTTTATTSATTATTAAFISSTLTMIMTSSTTTETGSTTISSSSTRSSLSISTSTSETPLTSPVVTSSALPASDWRSTSASLSSEGAALTSTSESSLTSSVFTSSAVPASTSSSKTSSSTEGPQSTAARSILWTETSGDALLSSSMPAPTTTADQISSTSATSTSSRTVRGSRFVEAARAVKAAGTAAVAALIKGVLTNITQESEVGPTAAFAVNASLFGRKSRVVWGQAGVGAFISRTLVEGLPMGATLGMVKVASDEMTEAFAEAETGSSARLDPSSIVDLSFYDGSGRYVPTVLSEPLLFRLSGNVSGAKEKARCVFLDITGPVAKWSSVGVRRASDSEVLARGQDPSGIWCWTDHLSIFAAIWQALLGCTNMELFTPEAVRAVLDDSNENWQEADSAVAVFVVAAVLTALFLLGLARECWACRLGCTQQAVKPLKCFKCLELGPKLLKYKFTAFIVYLKDVVTCLRSYGKGREKLKKATLTAAVQRFLAVKTGVSVGCISSQIWDGSGWLETKASIPRTVLATKVELHSGLADDIIEEFWGAGVISALRRCLFTFWAIHPLIDSMRAGAGSLTVAKRMLLQVAATFGVFATNALTFNFSGEMRSWEADEECPIEATSQLFILVATTVSVLVNLVPNKLLSDLGKQVYGRPFWNLAFWMAAVAYLSFSLFLVLVALANLNKKDQAKWYKSVEWGMLIKNVGMPAAQCLRQWTLLEMFLREDRHSEPKAQFRRAIGLDLAEEMSQEEHDAVEAWASHTVTAEELVHFASVLGKSVMPEFDPKSSCSDDVLNCAVVPFCLTLPDSVQQTSVRVLGVSGWSGQQELAVNVLRLSKQQGAERRCLEQQMSREATVVQRQCHWGFKANFSQLQSDEALGFVVMEKGQQVGVACLPLEDIVAQGRSWQGELAVRSAALMEEDCFMSPPRASPLPSMEVTGSGGEGAKAQAVASVTVHVEMPEELPQDVPRSKAPPDVVVMHSGQACFLQLVAAVLAEALGGSEQAYVAVERKLGEGDFQGLRSLLEEAGCQQRRYWIDIFAMGPGEAGKAWSAALLARLPAIVRSLRRRFGEWKAAEVLAGREAKPLPMQQLLAVDGSSRLMHEETALAAMMLGHSLHLAQELVLHPSLLHGGALGGHLHSLLAELSKGQVRGKLPWAMRCLEEPQAVYDTVKDLVVACVKKYREDEESTWKELDLTDVAAVVGARALSQGFDRGTDSQADDTAAGDDGGGDGD